jgi:hypothetical protein
MTRDALVVPRPSSMQPSTPLHIVCASPRSPEAMSIIHHPSNDSSLMSWNIKRFIPAASPSISCHCLAPSPTSMVNHLIVLYELRFAIISVLFRITSSTNSTKNKYALARVQRQIPPSFFPSVFQLQRLLPIRRQPQHRRRDSLAATEQPDQPETEADVNFGDDAGRVTMKCDVSLCDPVGIDAPNVHRQYFNRSYLLLQLHLQLRDALPQFCSACAFLFDLSFHPPHSYCR